MADKHLTAYLALRDSGINFKEPSLYADPNVTIKHRDKLLNWARCFNYKGHSGKCKAESFYKLLRLEANKKKWDVFYESQLEKDLLELKQKLAHCNCKGDIKATHHMNCPRCRKPIKKNSIK